MTPTMPELVDEMLRLSGKLDDAISFLYRHASEVAEAEDAYRQAKALAYVKVKQQAAGKPTVDEIKAGVDLVCQAERQRAHLADYMWKAANEAIRSRRTQLSCAQSVANAVRAELDMTRTAGGMAA